MKEKKRTVSPPTGEYSATFQIRVCAEHLYPVGLVNSGNSPFVCLLKYHKLEIEQTKYIESNLNKFLPNLMKEGGRK